MRRSPSRTSLVFGEVRCTERTRGGELFVNPITALHSGPDVPLADVHPGQG
ncbi:hypothetical protein QFZ74_005789 [Streptomyces sp. V3I7]|nr:hypothetical protein [Streptomyces sp. V3I7]